MVSCLKEHLDIHQDKTLGIRQLEPSSDALPIHIYGFTNAINWNDCQDIQSDMFDRIFSVLPEPGLRAHEAPTGHDVRLLVENHAKQKD